MALENTTQRKSYRMMFRYWLDTTKDDELALAHYCESLKQKRLFTSTIRQALTLIRDLREGHLDSLFVLFPWVHAWLEERAEAIAEAQIRQGNDNEKHHSQEGIDHRLDRIEALLLNDNNSVSSLKSLPVPKLLDEPKITIKKAENGKTAGYNFQFSLAKSTGMGFDHMDTDCLLYLLDNGRITRKDLHPETLARIDMDAQHTTQMAPIAETPSGGIKKMDIETDLPLPDFDDEDEDFSLITVKAGTDNG